MASITITYTHPVLSVEETLTVNDAKLVEFADLLIADYGGETPLTRSEAVQRFALGQIQAAKDNYRRLKRLEDLAAIVDEEIDA